MLNEDIKIERKEAKEFPPMPEDVYQVELLDISVEERATYDTRNKPDSEKEFEKVFNFQFVVLDHRELRGRNIWANFVPVYLYVSKKGPNKLYQIVSAYLRHEPTPEDEAKLDSKFLNSLVGKQCRVFVETKTSGDKKFNNIVKFMRIDSELTPLTTEEKEKAKVKKKEEAEHTAIQEGDTDYTDPASIPF